MIIDLCSGLGRFEGDEVISIDTNPAVKPTIVADVRYLPLRPKLKPALVHASPPCRWISWAKVRKEGYHEEMVAETFRIIAACFDAFAYLDAQTWTMENPGTGVLQKILPPDARTSYRAGDICDKRTAFWSNNKGLKRAIIPREVREQIQKVIT